MINILSKLRIEGNFYNLIRDIYKKPIANIISKIEIFPSEVRNWTQRWLLFGEKENT